MKLRKIKLGKLIKIEQGFAFKSSNYVSISNYRLVTLGNFSEDNGFKFNDNNATYYEGEFPDKVILKEGDLILPLTEQVSGLLGNTALVPQSKNYTFVLNQRVGKIICNEELVDKLFIHYLLSTNLVKKQLESMAHGTRQHNISPSDIYNVIVFIPTLKEQRRIGKFLYEIETKIANNNAISKELEAMAKTIYDYWFLQFEFPDKDGKPYKSNGGKMVWNDQLKQEIPEGWEIKTIQDVAQLGNGINYSKDIYGDKTYKIVNVRDITSSHLLINDQNLTKIELPNQNLERYFVNSNDILIARSGTPGAVRILAPTTDKILFAGFIIHCLPNNPALRWYLTYSLKGLEGTNATTTGGSILKNVSQTTLKAIKIVLPPEPIVEKFNRQIMPMIELLQCSLKENNQLKSLRDFLLPMLMNGQVALKD